MTCRDVHALLPDFRTGGLPRGTREAFVRHLAGCASCGAYVDSYDTTVALARDAMKDDSARAPRDLEGAILLSRKNDIS